jgi:hypothetical protein
LCYLGITWHRGHNSCKKSAVERFPSFLSLEIGAGASSITFSRRASDVNSKRLDFDYRQK